MIQIFGPFVSRPPCRYSKGVLYDISQSPWNRTCSVILWNTVLWTLFSFIARLITKVHDLRTRMMHYIGPIIEVRLERRSLDGADWAEEESVCRLCIRDIGISLLTKAKNDIITWLIDGAINAGQFPTVEDISSRVLLISFTSIHTTSAVRVLSLPPYSFRLIYE